MDMTGERLIEAPRETIWAALNDPEILKASIPGCESIEKLSDTEMKAVAAIKIGPIAARFNGRVTLSELDPPNGYTISGEGQGGVAGHAKGGAKVALTDEAGGTKLSYVVNAQIGGKMAQLGARLIDATAKNMAEQFFTRFAAIVVPPVAVVAVEHEVAHSAADEHDHAHDVAFFAATNPRIAGLPLGVWIPLVIAAVALTIVFGKLL